MNVLITLNSGQGANIGPNCFLSCNSGTYSQVVTITQLLNGLTISVPNEATLVYVDSIGVCTSKLTLTIVGLPTTITPTAAPTTVTPTVSPTTVTPTVTPTASPTTITPTVSPTTVTPTVSPTTVTPTVSPTTLAPTIPPTVTPTAPPGFTTMSPTTVPPGITTVTPTIAPTTVTPTVSPTTVTPTVTPTAAPTAVPTAVPTVTPTVGPNNTYTAMSICINGSPGTSYQTSELPFGTATGSRIVDGSLTYYIVGTQVQAASSPWGYPVVTSVTNTHLSGCPAVSPTVTPTITPTAPPTVTPTITPTAPPTPTCYSFTLTCTAPSSADFDVTDCSGNISTVNVTYGVPQTACYRTADLLSGTGTVDNNGLCSTPTDAPTITPTNLPTIPPSTDSPTTETPTVSPTTIALPNEVALHLNTFTIGNPLTSKADYNFDVKNGTVSSANIGVRVSNVTRGSGTVAISVSTSLPGTIDNYTGLTSTFGLTNIAGDTFLVEFSIDGGSTWAGTVYLSSPSVFDYPA